MRLAGLLVVAGCGFSGPPVGRPSVDAAQELAKTISIHPTGVGADLTGFPMLFFEAADPDLAGHAAAEISFRDGMALPVELEHFDPATGAIAAWVRIPVLHAATPTDISLRLDGARAAGAVWDDDFSGVYHFADGAGVGSLDSGSHHHDGTRVGAPAIVPGVVGDALMFTNANTYVGLGTAISLAGPFTISLWTRAASDTPSAYGRLVTRCDVLPARNGVSIEQNTATGFAYATRSQQGTTLFASTATPLSTTAPVFISATYDGVTFAFFENGTVGQMADVRVLADPQSTLTIGEEVYPPSTVADGYVGMIDEVRFSRVARSLAWEQVELANTSAPAAFYDVQGRSTVNVEP